MTNHQDDMALLDLCVLGLAHLKQKLERYEENLEKGFTDYSKLKAEYGEENLPADSLENINLWKESIETTKAEIATAERIVEAQRKEVFARFA